MTWTPKTVQPETWSARSQQAEAWTPKTQQGESWTSEAPDLRVFDPYVFDNAPIFDTGTAAGVWDLKANQTEVWTEA